MTDPSKTQTYLAGLQAQIDEEDARWGPLREAKIAEQLARYSDDGLRVLAALLELRELGAIYDRGVSYQGRVMVRAALAAGRLGDGACCPALGPARRSGAGAVGVGPGDGERSVGAAGEGKAGPACRQGGCETYK